MRKKKWIALRFSGLLALSMAACGSSPNIENIVSTENETAVLSDEAKKELIILNNRYSELLANTSGRDSSDAIRVNRKTLALISGNRHIEDDDALYTAALRTPDKENRHIKYHVLVCLQLFFLYMSL